MYAGPWPGAGARPQSRYEWNIFRKLGRIGAKSPCLERQMTSMTEWEFTADVAKWITEVLAKNARLPFSEAKCEQRGSGSHKRLNRMAYDYATAGLIFGGL